MIVSKIYTFEPEGLSFALPATLTLPYDAARLPAGYEEGSVLIHRRSASVAFNGVGDEGEDETESHGQALDTAAKTLTVRIREFSDYGAVGNRQANTWVTSTQTIPSGTATLVVRRPPGGMRTARSVRQNDCASGTVALPTRIEAAIQGVVIHTTNGQNTAQVVDGALGWLTNNCVRFFTQYLIDINGDVFQLTDDLATTEHIGGRFSSTVTPRTDLTNGNTIGIEVLNNVGEPYDGRQIASRIRLVDFLHEKFNLPRPVRNPVTGLYQPNRVDIALGGERLITHFDFNGKCDPIGSMRSSAVYYPVDRAQGCALPAVPIVQGDANAPSLLDAMYDTLAMLQRDRQHTGIILASGGDARGLALSGNGGNVTLRENVAAVVAVLGADRLELFTENTPLIVGPGATRALNGQQTFTDAIIAGRLELTGDLELRLKGTFYLSPTGRIVCIAQRRQRWQLNGDHAWCAHDSGAH